MSDGVTVTQLREGDFRVIRLQNGLVQADVVPELGGKIWRLTHLPSDFNLFDPHQFGTRS